MPLFYTPSGTVSADTGLTFSTSAAQTTIFPVVDSIWRNFHGNLVQATVQQNNTLESIQPFILQWPMAFSNLYYPMIILGATTNNTSSVYFDMSASAIFYSRNVSTLSYITSISVTFTSTWASNVSIPNNVYAVTMSNAAATTFAPGEYYLAFHVSTDNTATNTSTATTALGNTVSLFLGYSMQTNNQIRALNPTTGSNLMVGALPGAGLLGTNATRSSLAFTDYSASGTGTRAVLGIVAFELRNQTFW